MRSDLYGAGEKFVLNQIKGHSGLELFMQGKNIASIYPPEFLWGYSYHSHCIPPFMPESVLILGYGRGQIAHLMRKVYGNDLKITGVDLVPQDYRYTEYKINICDAQEFVKQCTAWKIIKDRFDYIVVDLFDGDKVPEFVFGGEFAKRLYQLTKRLLCINTLADDFYRLKSYADYGFKFHRFVPIFGNTISYWGL